MDGVHWDWSDIPGGWWMYNILVVSMEQEKTDKMIH